MLYTWASDVNAVQKLLTDFPKLDVKKVFGPAGNSPLLVAARNFIAYDIVARTATNELKEAAIIARDRYGAIIKEFVRRGAEYHPTYRGKTDTFDLPENAALSQVLGR
jgi:hypothetical protein